MEATNTDNILNQQEDVDGLEKENQDRLEAIMALKELVKKQRSTITNLKKEQRERRLRQKQQEEKQVNFIEKEEFLEANDNMNDVANGDTPNDEEQPAGESRLKRQSTIRITPQEDQETYCDLTDDVYSMIFLADFGSQSFWFGISVFALKVVLFTFIAIDLFHGDSAASFGDAPNLVLAAQFFMLPVAVAIQEDLITSYAVIANTKYHVEIQETCRGATKIKFKFATCLRLADGLYSLAVNVILLLQSTEVLSLFLNFAALQFLQRIDDVAFELAADGFMTDGMENVVTQVKTIGLPAKSNKLTTKLDSILFLTTYLGLLAAWIAVILL